MAKRKVHTTGAGDAFNGGLGTSSGIRSKETALAMIEAGASRLGTSSGIAIVSAE